MPTGKRSFPLHLDSVESICAFVHEVGQGALSQKGWLHMDIALDEAVRNIVLHSGLTTSSQIVVQVDCASLPDGLSVTLRDEGKPFDPVAAPQDTFGLRLLHRLVDRLTYERSSDQNVLTMLKGREK